MVLSLCKLVQFVVYITYYDTRSGFELTLSIKVQPIFTLFLYTSNWPGLFGVMANADRVLCKVMRQLITSL